MESLEKILLFRIASKLFIIQPSIRVLSFWTDYCS